MFVTTLRDALLVELKRLRDIVEHAEVVDDQAVRLRLAVGPVRAADRLQQRVVAQRLVEIHRLEDRRVEAGEQLRGDDQDLQRVGRVAEAIEQLLLGVAVAAVGAYSSSPLFTVITMSDISGGRCSSSAFL